jgi:hypothetical protein
MIIPHAQNDVGPRVRFRTGKKEEGSADTQGNGCAKNYAFVFHGMFLQIGQSAKK